MSEDILTYLSKRIREEQRRIEEDMAMGKAADYGAYQHAAGMYRGLLVANNMLTELKERMEQTDE